MSNAIVPIMSVNDALVRYEAVKHLASAVMVKGVDYGVIPGTNKPTLLKPGAEKLCSFFGMYPFLEVADKTVDWTGKDFNGEPFFYFSYRCSLYFNGVIIAQGEGSCNSWEKKYRWRDATPVCPNCGKMTVYKSKPPQNGWYCWNKKGGCGATFKPGDKTIESQAAGQMANPDIADVVNTLQKMAQKRALIAAVLIGANASEFFTQDLEDFTPAHIDGDWLEVTKTTDKETGEITEQKQAATKQPQERKEQPRPPLANVPKQATPPAEPSQATLPAAPVEKVLVADIIKELISEYPGLTITEGLNAINSTDFMGTKPEVTTQTKISKAAGDTIKVQVKARFDHSEGGE